VAAFRPPPVASAAELEQMVASVTAARDAILVGIKSEAREQRRGFLDQLILDARLTDCERVWAPLGEVSPMVEHEYRSPTKPGSSLWMGRKAADQFVQGIGAICHEPGFRLPR
jgi:hypothetical protein